MVVLAHKLRYARRNKDLSQKELGKKLGISEMAISAYETGRAIPPLRTLQKISNLTGFPLDFFTEEKDRSISLNSLSKEIKAIKKSLNQIILILKNKNA